MSAEQLLGSVPDDDLIIVADLEAGIGTLTRLDAESIDVVIAVVEPTPRSIDVAQRAADVATEQGRLIIVANKVADADDRARLSEAFGDRDIVFVPDDEAIDAADRRGVSPVDGAPGSRAVVALEGLVDLVLRDVQST